MKIINPKRDQNPIFEGEFDQPEGLADKRPYQKPQLVYQGPLPKLTLGSPIGLIDSGGQQSEKIPGT